MKKKKILKNECNTLKKRIKKLKRQKRKRNKN